jgi:hypothetical protein
VLSIPHASVPLVHVAGIERRVAIGIASVLEVARSLRMRDRENMLKIAHSPHCLHSHDHVLQDMTMDL